MTRMIKVDHEYTIQATATQSISIKYKLLAPDEEAAEERFQNLFDDGKFSLVFKEQSSGYMEIEIDWVEKTGTMQER